MFKYLLRLLLGCSENLIRSNLETSIIKKGVQINPRDRDNAEQPKSRGLLCLKGFHDSNTTELYMVQSHSICKQLKATDFLCIVGHEQLESRQ